MGLVSGETGEWPLSKKGQGHKAKEQNARLSTDGSTAIHCPCAFSSDPGPPDGQEQMSSVHSQVEMATYMVFRRGIEKEMVLRTTPVVVTILEMQGPHR